MENVYDCTNEFENQLAHYTGAKYAVAVDNMSNGLFLALYYENYVKKSIKTNEIKTQKIDKFGKKFDSQKI